MWDHPLKEPDMKSALTLMLILASASMTLAEPLTGSAAKKVLFPLKGTSIEMRADSGLSEQDQAILAAVAAQQPYYGAIAISPADGMMSEATVAAANYHDTAAAEAAALAECNSKKAGDVGCVIAALIRPEGYVVRPIQLSLDATAAFRKDYPRRGGALAISSATGSWGIGKGAEAAMSACAAKTGAADCAVVIAN